MSIYTQYTTHVRILHSPTPSRLQHCLQISQPVADCIIAVVSIPLLVIFGLLLQAQGRPTIENKGNVTESFAIHRRTKSTLEDRGTAIGLGILTIVLIFLIFGYLLQRLGACSKKTHKHQVFQHILQPQSDQYNSPGGLACTVQIFADNPPSYEMVTNCSNNSPPIYDDIIII